jgi:hypothetical protein
VAKSEQQIIQIAAPISQDKKIEIIPLKIKNDDIVLPPQQSANV